MLGVRLRAWSGERQSFPDLPSFVSALIYCSMRAQAGSESAVCSGCTEVDVCFDGDSEEDHSALTATPAWMRDAFDRGRRSVVHSFGPFQA